MTLKLSLYLLRKFSRVPFTIVLISGISTMVQGMLEYPNKILNTSIGNILKYHYQYDFSNNTGSVSVFYKDTSLFSSITISISKKKLKHQNSSIQRSLLTLNTNNFSKFASPKEVLLVSKIIFPPWNKLFERAEEALGALNFIKTCFTLGNG
jgi:hypothetical protein